MILQVINKVLSQFLNEKNIVNNLIFEKRLLLLKKICNLLKICRISNEIDNSFCFIYSFMLIFSYLLVINPNKHVPKMVFILIEDRLNIIIKHLVDPAPQIFKLNSIINQEALEKISFNIWEIFHRIKLGKNYFKVLENLLLSNCKTIWQIRNPCKNSNDLNENDDLETKFAIKNLVEKLPNEIYSFEAGSSIDHALTVATGEIGIIKTDVDNALESFKGKFYLILTLYHEICHVFGLSSYKKWNYFMNSPEKLIFEAWNLLPS